MKRWGSGVGTHPTPATPRRIGTIIRGENTTTSGYESILSELGDRGEADDALMMWVSFQEERDKAAIVLVAEAVEALQRLGEQFLQVANSNESVDLGALEGFELDRVRALVLERNEGIGFLDRSVYVEAENERPPSFRWARSGDAWRDTVDRLNGLISAGGSGHQYLTDNTGDAAEVRVSFGEEFP